MHSGAGPFAGQQSLAPSKNPSDSPILFLPHKKEPPAQLELVTLPKSYLARYIQDV